MQLQGAMKQFIAVLFISLISIQGQSEEFTTIKGEIFDAFTKESLQGATVSDHNHSVTTNEYGIFSISTSDTVLTFSYVGYQTQRIRLTRKKFILVELNKYTNDLNAVVVNASMVNRKLFKTPNAVNILSKKDLNKSNGNSILPSLNTVPGVKMVEQAPGNFKISLRGSALRDAYGIRNIKMYWEDIPLTSPDNSAAHSLNIEPSQLGSIEVIKGPAGSIYGAGMGGVIIFKNDKPEAKKQTLSTMATVGSYGLFNSSTTYLLRNQGLLLSANYSHLSYTGYRENEWSHKDAINLYGKIFTGSSRTISFIVNHDMGNYGIAGSVDSIWARNTPRKAVAFSKENKTGVPQYHYTLAGVSQEYAFNKQLSNTTSIYGNFQDMNHSYGQSMYYNGYLKQHSGGFGGRTTFHLAGMIGKIRTTVLFGDEFQYERLTASTSSLENGQPGELNVSNRIHSISNIFFAQSIFDLPYNFSLTLGGSFNKLYYEITDLMPESALHHNASGSLNYPATVSPKASVEKVFNSHAAAYISVSHGFSPPVVSETKNPDGSFNKNLEPEKGTNYELGLHSKWLNEKLKFNITAYRMYLHHAILPTYNEFGIRSYHNTGNIDQKGIEASLGYQIIDHGKGLITSLQPWVNYTFNDYLFKNYVEESVNSQNNEIIKTDMSGNKVTGVSPNMLNAGIDLNTKPGIYVNIVFNYNGRAPINDLNTHYQDGYSLLSVKLGYQQTVGRFLIDGFAGGNNLLDQQYSSWISYNADTNGNAPLFYNPSPAINFYGGLCITYHFKKGK